MNYEYKVVGGPERAKRRRGARTSSDRVAAAFEEILKAEAVEGWEYLRTDTVPVTERAGWFSPARTVSRAVLVFRRPLEAVWRRPGPEESERQADRTPKPTAAPRPEPSVGTAPKPVRGPDPALSAEPDRHLAEVVRGPGAPPRDH